MNILFVTPWYPTQEKPVLGIFIKDIAKAVSLSHEVVILTSGDPIPSLKRFYQTEATLEENLRVLRLRYRKFPLPLISYFGHLWGAMATVRLLRQEGFQPDIIHAHVFEAGLIAVPLARRFKIPLIISEHSSAFQRGRIRRIEKIKAKYVFNRASVVCPVSEDMKRRIQSLTKRVRLRVIPNPVDPSFFLSEGHAEEPLQASAKRHILLVALLKSIKNIPILLEAMTLLKLKRNDFILDIVGDGPQRSDYEQEVRELGLTDYVIFHGLKSKKEVADFMKQCVFLVLPSLYETFGIALVEAMACGKPVIATSRGGPVDIVSEDTGRLVPPGDSEALADAMDYMLDHFGEFDSKKIAGLARSQYSYEAVGRQWNLLYRSLI